MRVAIMQPYFLPYIGYFQLLGAVDRFIIYDNIKYTKKGWINRNRFLQNGADALFSIPLKKDSDFLDVRQREVSEAFDRTKLLDQVRGAYAKAPEFAPVFAEMKEIISCPEVNLFAFIFNSVQRVCTYLDIKTPIEVSSTVPIDHEHLKGEDKVMTLCKAVGATHYINPIGGVEIYDKSAFAAQGIELSFLQTGDVSYPQFNHPFVPHLSILDVMMFNSVDQIRTRLRQFELI